MIKPTCDSCTIEIETPGALLFSPPEEDGKTVKKFHLCTGCFRQIKIVIDHNNKYMRDSQSRIGKGYPPDDYAAGLRSLFG